ncbi:hypothetical protein KSB_05610 [Ktedonobacter robiniae]|uniref:Uncharacterized protein n=1 Tax=Ktedonobacter robiniae TaxID=2778365 RepID=A0ABQ3UHA0_9CHLR|nr:hypothetical protein KSB_05610 [Ktedonobacter robiniae]
MVTSDGIQFHTFGYSIYTPWSNIVCIAPRPLGAYNPPSLILKESAPKGRIEDGRQCGVATIKLSRWAGERNDLRVFVPLIYTLPRRNWEVSDLGMAIRNYVPQLFNADPAGSPDEQ